MSMEADFCALLMTVCPRVYPDVAPANVALPYVTWQALGGASVVYTENTPADIRNTLMQVNVWSSSRLQALQIIRAVEAAMYTAPAFTAKPMGEPMSTFEPAGPLYGSIQRFSIWASR